MAYSPYAAPLFVSAFIAALVGTYTWPRRHVKGAWPLLLITAAITIWCLGYAFEIMATSLATKVWWAKSQYLGISFLPYFWLLFSVVYASRRPTYWWPLLRWLAILPMLTLLLALTNEWHGLIWAEVALLAREDLGLLLLNTRFGLWFWVHTAVSYLFLFWGTVLLLRGLWYRQHLYRAQVVVVTIAALTPWIANVLFLSDLTERLILDITPFALTVTAVLLGWAILSYRLVDIVPIARDLVLESMRQGVIVVNSAGRVADMNPAAAHIVGLPVAQALGNQATDVLTPWPHLLPYLQAKLETETKITIGQGAAQTTYQVHIVPLYDRQQIPLGHILTIQPNHKPADFPLPTPPEHGQQLIETAVATPPTSLTSNPLVRAITNFFVPPPLEDPGPFARENLLAGQLLEQALTIMLRFGTTVAILGLLIANQHLWAQAIPTQLGLVLGIMLLFFLSLLRTVKFNYRARLTLLIIYIMAVIELASYGYSVEVFILMFTLIALAVLLQGLSTGLLVASTSLLTLVIFGWHIAADTYQPLTLGPAEIALPTTFELAVTSIFIFIANVSAIIIVITFMVQSINKAWRQETQARNLLQQERDKLDERVIARTQQIKQREAILEAASFSSEQLLQEGDWEIVLPAILARLGQAALASRVYFFKREPSQANQAILVSQYHEWVAPGITPQIDNPDLQNLPLLEIVPRWLAHFEKGQQISGLVKTFPASEQAVLESQEILSMAIMPIMVDGDWFGFIEFDECTGERVWSPSEVEALTIAANNIGSAIQRQQRETALAQSEARQRALLNAIPDLIFRNHRDGTFLDCHIGTESKLLLSPAQFIGHKATDILSPALSHSYMKLIQQALETDKEAVHEYTVMVDGQPVYFEARVVASGPDEALAIIRDVTDRRQLEAKSIDLALERERSQLLRDFVQNTSHEFRTPLAIIGMTLSTLAQMDREPAQQRALERASRQIPRLVRLLDMTLSMTRLDQDDLVLRPERVDLNQFLGYVLVKMEKTAVDKNISLSLQPEPTLPTLTVDVNWLREAMVCLLDNSIRFTPDGGTVTIRTAQQADQAIITIQDSGVGISAQHLPHIFERFWRLDKAHTQPGFGLGLPIAQRVVEVHGGTIAVESELDAGTTVIIKLPLTANATVVAP